MSRYNDRDTVAEARARRFYYDALMEGLKIKNK